MGTFLIIQELYEGYQLVLLHLYMHLRGLYGLFLVVTLADYGNLISLTASAFLQDLQNTFLQAISTMHHCLVIYHIQVHYLVK
jgi:hypothetical protein